MLRDVATCIAKSVLDDRIVGWIPRSVRRDDRDDVMVLRIGLVSGLKGENRSWKGLGMFRWNDVSLRSVMGMLRTWMLFIFVWILMRRMLTRSRGFGLVRK